MSLLPSYRLYATFVDSEGEESTVIAYLPVVDPTLDVIGTVQDLAHDFALKVQNVSTAQLKSCGFAVEQIEELGLRAFDSTRRTPNIEDKLQIAFKNGVNGQQYRLSVPAPINDAFLTDRETVDWTQIDVDALVGAIEGTYSTNSGVLGLVRQTGGLRRSKTRSKVRTGIPSEMGG